MSSSATCKIIQTTCPYCGVGCGMDVSPKKIKVKTDALSSYQVKVIGSSNHPANFGKLCVKGSSAGETVDFEGRMLQPQVNGKIVSWDSALDTVADKFSEIIKKHGSDSVAFYVSGQFLTEDYYVANKLMKGFMGSANIDTNSRLCMASAVIGYKRAFGSDTVPCSYEDLDMAEMITFVGSNAAWAHPIVYQRIVAAKRLRPDMKIVVVDPRKTATCDVADLHLALKPGTDAVLYNGLLSYLAKSSAFNADYVANYTEGFASALEIANKLQGSVEETAKQCELKVEDVQQFFDWSVQNDKMINLYSQGVNQSSSGVDKSNAIINCHLVTGRIGREGMGPFSITGQPNAMGGREVGGLANQLAAHMDFSKPENIDKVSRFWDAQNMAQQNGLKAIDMFEAVGSKKIKAIWIMNTNPVVSMPNADAVKKALQGCEMVVVSDCMQNTDTTQVADVLLPALTWGEIDGTVTNSDRTISRQRKFMDGPDNAKADWWILTQVAHKMGFAKQFNYKTEVDIFKEYAALSGFENNGKRDFDISLLDNITEQEYADLSSFQWPLNSKAPQGTKRMFADNHFFTASSKAQFIAITPKAPLVATSKQYPFILNTGRVRDQWHSMTRTAKTPKLLAHTDEPYVALNPEDAANKNLKEGQLAKVHNQLGTLVVRVKIEQGQRKGSVFSPIHWTDQYASQGRVDVLIPSLSDPLSGQPEFKHSPVAVSPYNAKWHGFILTKNEINTENLDYWVKIKGKKFYRYEISSESEIGNIEDMANWAKEILSLNSKENVEFIDYKDQVGKRYRCASMVDGRLQNVLFIAPSTELPTRSWLGSIFSEYEIDAKTRLNLLAGQKSGAKDVGKIICSCFGIGINTIVEAIHKNKLTTPEAIGLAIKAGTNCGSCIPELTDIIAKELK